MKLAPGEKKKKSRASAGEAPASVEKASDASGGDSTAFSQIGRESGSGVTGPGINIANEITIRGARTHNLKNIHCAIPREKLTVVTGVSGSGKSSLAFDTLFAEGQRRYVESLSTYARQFLERLPRPDVDDIDHIPPAIALEQSNSVKNARSTIGTATEINDYLRLLFAKIGTLYCPDCDVAVERDTPASARALLEREGWGEGTRLMALAPQRLDDPGMFGAVVAEMRREGYTRLRLGEALIDTTDPGLALPAEAVEFEIVVDRLAWKGGEEEVSRLASAIEQAFRLGKGRAVLRTTDGREIRLHEDLVCRCCARSFRTPEPQLFSFYNPLGACKTCQGFGRVIGLDFEKIIPNRGLSLGEKCIVPWNTPLGSEMYAWLRKFKSFGLKWDVPFDQLPEAQQKIVLEGKGEWPGVRGFFADLEQKRYKVQSRILLARYRGFARCHDCEGARLVPEALWVKVMGKTIADLWKKSVLELRRWFREDLRLGAREEHTAELLLREIRSRLDYLVEVGLGYLTLDRQTRTLSGGEAQRINLATALGSALTETLYVLDEPTVGLHPRDTDRLIGVLRRLVDLNNTVVVVEHDLDVIRSADTLIDLGPQAGEQGGEIMFMGPPSECGQQMGGEAGSQTARYLRPFYSPKPENEKKQGGRKKAGGGASAAELSPAEPERPFPSGSPGERRRPTGWISVLGAHENNLRHLSVEIPLGVLACVTGVSGSGKTSLVSSCLYANFRRQKGDPEAEPGKILRLEGLQQVEDILFVDQSPIGRSARSNAATYLKAWDGIRERYSNTREARRAGLKPRHFSFNVEGGRCEACQGTGIQVIDMQFLADVEVPCETCDGRRFQPEVLAVELEGYNANQMLNLTVIEALGLFERDAKIRRGLQPLVDVGLGYLRLGQSTATLSGGEAQRLKLALHLATARQRSNVLLLFDEPTTGLHPADLDTLMGVFQRLLDEKFSLLVIEHNLELISRADWIIDLGPEGGEGGGDIVVAGVPEIVAAHPTSLTGKYLRTRF